MDNLLTKRGKNENAHSGIYLTWLPRCAIIILAKEVVRISMLAPQKVNPRELRLSGVLVLTCPCRGGQATCKLGS